MEEKEFIIGLRFLVGLPGAGKTTFANEFCRNNSKARIVSFDESYLESKNNNKFFDLVDVFKEQLKYVTELYSDPSCEYNKLLLLLDGLFLKENDIINTYLAFCKFLHTSTRFKYDDEIENVKIKLAIDYWNPNIDACLSNDKLRLDRKGNCESLIKNCKLEDPDIDRICQEIEMSAKSNKDIIPVSGQPLKSYKSTGFGKIYESVFKSRIDEIDKNRKRYIYSGSWTTGGRWGDYQGNSGSVTAEEPREFDKFDEIIEIVCPDISYLKYKKLYKKCVKTDDWTDYGYYGGYTEYRRYVCDVDELYKELKNLGYIVEKEEQNGTRK